MELTGIITWVGDTQTGTSKAGKEWCKREYVVEYESGEHPKRALFSILNDDAMGQLEVGKKVHVRFNINTKEWNGKIYNDIYVWKLEFVEDEQPSAAVPVQPARQQMIPNAPLADPNAPAPDNDDLPF